VPAYGNGFTSIFQDSGANFGGAMTLYDTLATDASGNVYASGVYSGSGTIDPAGTFAVNCPTQYAHGGFLAKYDSALNLQWALAPTVTPAAGSTAIEVEFGKAVVGAISHDVYVNGVVAGGSINLQTVGGTTLTISAPAAGGTTGFVARLDHATGNVVWLETAVRAVDIATDAAENVYLSGGSSPYLVKMDSNGNVVWTDNQIGSGVTYTGNHYLAVDAAGNIYFAGQFTGTADVDPSSGVKTLKAIGNEDDLVEKINTNGKLVWAVQSGAKNAWSSTDAVAVDGSGNVDVGGAGFSFGSGKNAASGNFAQFDNNGNLKWLINTASGGGGFNFNSEIALDPANNIYLNLGPIAKFSSAGTLDWSIACQNGPSNLAVDTAGDIWWSSPFTVGNNGQTNVSPTSPPVYLPIPTDPNTQYGAYGIVEWTQPGGFAAKAQSGSATNGAVALSASTPTASTGVTAVQPVIYIGNPTPAPTPVSVPAPSAENANTELDWLLGTI
jgi:hypothetical protein